MKIEVKAIEAIRPYAGNPRKNDAAVEAVANSIRAFGWQQPIVIDESGEILAGHTRYKAAKRLNMRFIPCIVAHGLTEVQKTAYRVADNKASELAGWDFSALDTELSKIDFSELDAAANAIDFSEYGESIGDFEGSGMEAFGFKKHELDAMMADSEVSELLNAFDITSPARGREEKRKEENANVGDKIIFTAQGRREDFGEDFWALASQLYARGIKTEIKESE